MRFKHPKNPALLWMDKDSLGLSYKHRHIKGILKLWVYGHSINGSTASRELPTCIYCFNRIINGRVCPGSCPNRGTIQDPHITVVKMIMSKINALTVASDNEIEWKVKYM